MPLGNAPQPEIRAAKREADLKIAKEKKKAAEAERKKVGVEEGGGDFSWELARLTPKSLNLQNQPATGKANAPK